MKNMLVTLLLAFIMVGMNHSQHLIGKNINEIKTVMRELMPVYELDNSTVNKVYKYLKYVDINKEQTMLIFLNEDDQCTLVKWMSDYSNLDDVVNDLNQKYKPVKQNEWMYMENNVKYSVTLTEEEWFFTIVIKKY